MDPDGHVHGKVYGVLNRGHIITDQYAAFNDSGGGAAGSDGTFSQNVENNFLPDPPRGLGVPLALNILSQFRTTSQGSLTSMVNGLVNINTAPLAVLRLLPMLSPDPFKSSMAADSSWLQQAMLGTSSNSRALYDSTKESWDLAAVLAAYRDRRLV